MTKRLTRSELFAGAQATGSSVQIPSSHLDLENQNDEKIEGLTSKVKILKEITLNIGETIKDSSSIIGSMSDDYSRTGHFLDGTMTRLKLLARSQDIKNLFIPYC
ncbi:12512_t:CDS:2 [Gigaspora margarita]|uniref:12512_t:CDS:1 n=1 Tax=Gigaspora margarita TaxID=4874 RepID=A0ABN7V8M4_GIGMA|nr:12512_t:CDS:2 [Gigaspora margarita]